MRAHAHPYLSVVPSLSVRSFHASTRSNVRDRAPSQLIGLQDDQHDSARISPASDQAPPSDATADSPPLTETIPNKIAATLESMEQAVKPDSDDTKTDPEVNEFKSLVAEVFSNMKESIAVSAPASATAPPSNSVAPTTPITDTPASEPLQQESKSVATSPVEAQQSLLMQVGCRMQFLFNFACMHLRKCHTDIFTQK